MSEGAGFPPVADPGRVGSYPGMAKAGGGFVWDAVLLQEEYIDEPEPGVYVHVEKQRVTEWPVPFPRRPRRTPETIPALLAPDAPANRLDVLRGLAP
jgi:hypothetical protein